MSATHDSAPLPRQRPENPAIDRWVLRGIIFDMDGTLVEPAIDFAEMRRRLHIPAGDILATIKSWPHGRRKAALGIIEEIEERATANLVVQAGARELLDFLDRHAIPKGIITRNTARTVRHLLEHLQRSFSEVITRDFEPVKPDPAPALHICRRWGIPPASVLMVGDYRDDLLCGRAAGMKTCLLRSERNREFSHMADFIVGDLHELLHLTASLVGGANRESP